MKVALVTGASSGMGREFVKEILQDSCLDAEEIWLLARRQNRMEEWIQRYPDRRFRLFPLDLQQESSYSLIRNALKEEKARICCFVHAAGFGLMGKIEEISEQEQLEMIDLNVKSTVALSQMIIPFLQPGARLIYLASAAAFLPQPGFAVYAAGKSFVLSFVRSLRREIRQKDCRITAVCPGAVKTEFLKRAAREKTLPAYKQLVMADKKKVVKKAWKDNGKNKEISIYGLPMKAFALAAKVLPHSMLLTFVKEG